MSVSEYFLKSPTPEILLRLKKDDIVEIANNLESDVMKSMSKSKLVRVVTEHMVDNDIFNEGMLNQLPVEIQVLYQV